MNIYLYGPPGSGKSTIGQTLADYLNIPFYDLDLEIERTYTKSITEIFQIEGEASFREYEHTKLLELINKPECVISLGGGALLDRELRILVEASGPIICLNAPLPELVKRLERVNNNRPLLSGNLPMHLENLLENRAAHYATFQWQVNTGHLESNELAWNILINLGRFHIHGMGNGYDVLVKPDGLEDIGEMFVERNITGTIGLVSDSNVSRLYADRTSQALSESGLSCQTFTLPAGEGNKTLASTTTLWEAFINAGLDRNSVMVALGGGVVSDLVGFASATYMRGVRWVILPTSLLGMVDACLGGKTGIDLPQGKNLIGAFYSPSLVVVDPNVLRTLPETELVNGLAEVIKHGVIGDPELFHLLSKNREPNNERKLLTEWEEIVKRSMAVKIKYILEDPYEKNVRAVLNYGHTIGHAVEWASGYRIKHGEAVAIGMVAEANLAERIGLSEPGLSEKIGATLLAARLPIAIPTWIDKQAILQGIRKDKKRKAGKEYFALPVQIGEVRPGIELEENEIWPIL